IDQTSGISDFCRTLSDIASHPSPLDDLLRSTIKLMSSDSAAFWGIDPARGILEMKAAQGLLSTECLPVPMGQGLPGRVAELREYLKSQDVQSDSRCLFPREAQESGIGSYLGVPVIGDGGVVGVLEVHTRQPHFWTEANVAALRAVGYLIAGLPRGS